MHPLNFYFQQYNHDDILSFDIFHLLKDDFGTTKSLQSVSVYVHGSSAEPFTVTLLLSL
jgi:hypothetical protein